MPVKRWMPRDSGARTGTSVSHRSCSSPPPTSTAPISVSSQRSPPRPLVSVSTTRNSAVARGAWDSAGESRSATDMANVCLYSRDRTACTRRCARPGRPTAGTGTVQVHDDVRPAPPERPAAAWPPARAARPPGRVPCRCMTPSAPHAEALDARPRQAWSSYREGLADLSGRRYDDAEAEAWDRLQDALDGIEAD